MQLAAKKFVRWMTRLIKSLTMKMKVIGHKLENPTVNYISLVDRGANRVPFRIVKRNKGDTMIDLGRIFKSAKANEEIKPTVVGLCVQKGVADDAVRNAIESAGFKVDQVVERDDGTLIYSQEANVKPEECTVIKMQKGLVLLMKGFDPYALMGQDMPFTELVKAQGFIPSVSVAFEALQNTMAGILYGAPTGGGDEVIGKVDQALGDFHKYVLEQAKAIPTSAFKAEHDIAEILNAAPEDQQKPNPPDPAPDDDDDDDDGDAGNPPVTKSEDKGLTAEQVQEIAASAMKPIQNALTENIKAIKTLTESISEQSRQLKSVSAAQDKLSKKVDDVEAVAKAANDKMKGTVIGGAPAGDRVVSKAENADEDPRTGTFDTAFLPAQWRDSNIRKMQSRSRKS